MLKKKTPVSTHPAPANIPLHHVHDDMDLSKESFHEIFLQVMAEYPDDDDRHIDAPTQDTRRSSDSNTTSPLPSDVVVGRRPSCGSVLPEILRAHAEAYTATARTSHH
jgi:hypothetical protein|uniref:Uncharacterized protein n=1 Tax=Phaeodactylum tricornutum TaxID=2850 RepID=A0A8J9X9F7_PHATR